MQIWTEQDLRLKVTPFIYVSRHRHRMSPILEFASPAACVPEMTVVPVTLPRSEDGPSLSVFPSCTRLERCGGCCSHPLLSCQPTREETVTLKVLVVDKRDFSDRFLDLFYSSSWISCVINSLSAFKLWTWPCTQSVSVSASPRRRIATFCRDILQTSAGSFIIKFRNTFQYNAGVSAQILKRGENVQSMGQNCGTRPHAAAAAGRSRVSVRLGWFSALFPAGEPLYPLLNIWSWSFRCEPREQNDDSRIRFINDNKRR